MFVLKLLMVFILTVIADWLWAMYIIHTSDKKALKASIMAVLVWGIGSIITISYIDDKRLLIAGLFGAFVGTYLSIWYSNHKDKSK